MIDVLEESHFFVGFSKRDLVMIRDCLAQILVLGDSARHIIVGCFTELIWEIFKDAEIIVEV